MGSIKNTNTFRKSGGGATAGAVEGLIVGWVGEGNALVIEAGAVSGLPVEAAVPATCWDYLTNGMAGLADQGAAVKRWDSEYQALAETAGVAAFLWPTNVDGSRDLSGCREIVTDQNLAITIAAQPAAIAAVDQILWLKFKVTASGGTRTVGFAGSAIPVVWFDGLPAKEVAVASPVTFHVRIQDGAGIATFGVPD